MSDNERGSVSKILDAVKAHANALETFREDHSGKSAAIEDRAHETFEQRYMVSWFGWAHLTSTQVGGIGVVYDFALNLVEILTNLCIRIVWCAVLNS